jgi:hypothetical protein
VYRKRLGLSSKAKERFLESAPAKPNSRDDLFDVDLLNWQHVALSQRRQRAAIHSLRLQSMGVTGEPIDRVGHT